MAETRLEPLILRSQVTCYNNIIILDLFFIKSHLPEVVVMNRLVLFNKFKLCLR